MNIQVMCPKCKISIITKKGVGHVVCSGCGGHLSTRSK